MFIRINYQVSNKIFNLNSSYLVILLFKLLISLMNLFLQKKGLINNILNVYNYQFSE